MESYRLQKRIILSFETKQYEDGDTDYTYIVDMWLLFWLLTCSCSNRDHSLYALTLSTGIVRVVKAQDFETVPTHNLNNTAIFCSRFVPFDESCVVVCDQ